ncbi:prepilin-type N-terminal cleavage/methylation domain-containing protein [Candidatus Gracilibacteria bacterium]|nr:prepilin-type N-terminal cleavage/methylation domain-containing protein [Candidatus Gracilibacteria bacterium]
MYTRHPSTSGFTLMEVMIVVLIIIFLFSFAIFPYSYYMKRSYVERSRDILGQEWILAHKEIRNGKLFDGDQHARTVLIFEKGSENISEYKYLGTDYPELTEFTPTSTNPNIKFEKYHEFDSGIKLQKYHGFTGAESNHKFGYMIQPPFGKGVFFTGGLNSEFTLTGIYLTIGYNGASLETGHAREMLLRPYLQ